jgi:uncharacterized membrane protein
MRIATLVGLLSLSFGTFGLLASVLTGAASVVMVFVIPVFVFEGPLPVLSFIMVLAGIIVLAFSGVRCRGCKGAARGEGSWGGVVLVGPFPILFGNMKGTLPTHIKVILIGACVILTLLIAFTLLYSFL